MHVQISTNVWLPLVKMVDFVKIHLEIIHVPAEVDGLVFIVKMVEFLFELHKIEFPMP